jgi:coenzyme F420 hydrogenase subunit delta
MRDEILPDHCAKPVVVLCSGNPLRGDDGFGPAVAARLNASHVPPWAAVIDAGTGIRGLLFDMVTSERRPDRVLIVDAISLDSARESGDTPVRRPGEVFEIPLDQMAAAPTTERSVHLAPTAGLLRALHDAGTHVEVLVCQVAVMPEGIRPRLSPAVANAVEQATEWITKHVLKESPTD